MKISRVGAELFHADRLDEAISRFSQVLRTRLKRIGLQSISNETCIQINRTCALGVAGKVIRECIRKKLDWL